ncbi:unnamed protein product [Sordaria macrospora k-hell]|uniref:WGS project CABT00000000 data, contig 2.13 n=1 Tax=Sordaria macrospora (strain ATCC MYA-333 / DSM 997 / K(L3346) / K-hell) TaxID=771870 RepID=F7VY42_SORMK|nr:uncharacterized protein SMAC_07988 [Sordaria macrospora k-hell]CCC10436.1 unnamed protein product [Sordaria macrospora k-hell]
MNNHYPPPNGHGRNGQPDRRSSSNGYDGSGHQDQPPLDGHAISAPQDDLDFYVSHHFQTNLNQYNALHDNLNEGLSLLLNVNRDQRDKIQQQEQRINSLSSKADLFKRFSEDFECRVHELEAENRDLKARNQLLMNDRSNAFGCLIIDGDGSLFRDDYLALGEEGGREAAHKLHSELKAYLELVNPKDHIKDIVAKVFINVEGLSRAMMESGIIHEEDMLTKFGRGFSQAQPFFEFIDVGRGKEKADLKATRHFEFMVHLKQCKRVMLAACHDNGYATYLEEYRWASDKITLVETSPAVSGVAKLHKYFAFQKFPNIFRSELLLTKRRSHPSHPLSTPFGPIQVPPSPPPTYATKAQEPASGKKNQPETPSGIQKPNGACPSAGHLKGAPPSSAPVKRPSQTQAVESLAPALAGPQNRDRQSTDDDGYQTVGRPRRSTAHAYIQVGRHASSNGPVIGNSRNPQRNNGLFFYLNTNNQRIDYPFCRSHEAQGRKGVEDRTSKSNRNLCNGYHLIRRCRHEADSRNGTCDYVHEVDPPLTYEERTYLWYKARSVERAFIVYEGDPIPKPYSKA